MVINVTAASLGGATDDGIELHLSRVSRTASNVGYGTMLAEFYW